MKGDQAACQRLEALERRISESLPALPDEFWQLREGIRTVLQLASQEKRLKQGLRELRAPLFSAVEPDDNGIGMILGGIRAETWHEGGQFERSDGARFNFAIIVHFSKTDGLKLKAYHFNLSFYDTPSPAFVRFDLNESEFIAKDRAANISPLICHSHPGHGKMTLPSPILSPEEILDIILHNHLR